MQVCGVGMPRCENEICKYVVWVCLDVRMNMQACGVGMPRCEKLKKEECISRLSLCNSVVKDRCLLGRNVERV
jgi:hypothetical protein